MLKKIGAITAVDALTKLLGYLLLPVYLGLMPKIEFGEFGFLTSAISYASLILGLYLYVPFIRNFSALNIKSEKQKLVSTVFISLLLWLGFIDVFLIFLKPLLLESFVKFFEITVSADEKFYLAILAINTGIASLYCYSLLMARKKTREIIVFIATKFAALTILNLLLLYTNPWQRDTVVNRLWCTVVAELVITFSYVLTAFRPYLLLTYDLKVLQSNLFIAIPLIPSALIGLFISVIDRRLIVQHHGLADLANYNLAMQALAPIQMVMSAVQVAWAPHIFSIKNNNEALKQSLRLLWISLSVMIAATILIFFAIFSAMQSKFISIDYEKVPYIILLASFGAISSALSHICNNMFVQLSKTGTQLLISLLLLAINWALNIYLVPNYSSYGASVAAGVSNIIALLLAVYLLNKIVK